MKKKLVYGIITGGVVASSLGLVMLSTGNSVRADEASSAVTSAGTISSLTSTVVDETVYVFLNADGSVRKTISSDWTKNDLGADTYAKTEGKISTPIDVKITYYLDGKEVSADEIRGQSGRVKIRYDYTNTERVSGMYMPYAVISGAVLSNEKFSNVTVTNGKLMNDGARTAVVGLALPGMKANLGVDADIPEYVEIEADAKEFKMEMTATIATSKVFAELDTSALDSVNSLSSQLDTLASSMVQLMDGSVQLRDGLATLNDNTGILADGVKQLNAGALKLADGANSLSDGLATAVTGSQTLASGLSDATSGAKQLSSGATEAITKISTLSSSLAKLDESSEALITNADLLFNGTIQKLKGNQLLAAITAENFETVLTETIKAMKAAGNADVVADLTNTLGQLKFYQGVKLYVEGASKIAQGAAGAPEALQPLASGTASLVDGLTKLSGGATSLSSGLSDAYSGSKELATGMASLSAGISNLASNVPALTEGVSKLYEGSGSLSDGLSKFNDEGVQKLVSLYNGDVKALVNKVQNMVQIAKNSNTKVKYIYRTPEI